MADLDVFRRNLNRFSDFCRTLSPCFQLEDIEKADCAHIQFCSTEKEELNLKISAAGGTFYYHEQTGAVDEARRWLQRAVPSSAQVICFYGIGLGYHYDVLIEWLRADSSRFLVFIEADLAVLRRFLETERASKILEDTQVVVQYSPAPNESGWRRFRDEFAWFYYGFCLRAIEYYTLNIYVQLHETNFRLIVRQLQMNIQEFRVFVQEALHCQNLVSRNLYANLWLLDQCGSAVSFFDKFRNIPVIICGAGPSLARHFKVFPSLQNRAVIFGAGSAVNILTRHGIMPHLGICLDPYDTQESRCMTHFAYESAFFFFTRFYFRASKLIHGTLLHMPVNGGVHRWFQKTLGIPAIQERWIGSSSSNVSSEIAVMMGCNPIILTGLDLAYTDDCRYAPGVVVRPTDAPHHATALTAKDEHLIQARGVNNTPIQTRWGWVVEARDFAKLSDENVGVSFINATEEGMKIPDISNLSLKDVIKKRLQYSYDIENWIHCEIQESSTHRISSDNIRASMEKWRRSLARSLKAGKTLHVHMDNLLRRMRRGEHIAIEMNMEEQFTEWQQLINEPAYEELIPDQIKLYDLLVLPEMNKLGCFPHQYTASRRSEHILEMKRGRVNFINKILDIHYEAVKDALAMKQASSSPPSSQEDLLPVQPVLQPGEIYLFEEGRLIIKDPELGIHIEELFAPAMISENSKARSVPNEFIYAQTGSQEGQALIFYPCHAVKGECFYLNGSLHGPSTFYSSSGKLLSRCWFVRGERIGKSWKYYENGGVYSLQRYQDGFLHGRQEYYYQNGQKKTVMNYHQGLLEGYLDLYYPSGSRKRQQYFTKGQLHGKEFFWDDKYIRAQL